METKKMLFFVPHASAKSVPVLCFILIELHFSYIYIIGMIWTLDLRLLRPINYYLGTWYSK